MSLRVLRKGLLRLPSLASRPVRSASYNPAQDPVGPLETFIGLFAFYGATLGPVAYIMLNLENYKKKE